MYFGFSVTPVEAFAYDPVQQLINPTPTSTSGGVITSYPGASPSISSNGTSDGIVWVVDSGRHWSGGSQVLRAFDATNLGNELYDTDMSPDRDQGGPAVKFAVPTVADGWVFVGAHNEVDIYGLL